MASESDTSRRFRQNGWIAMKALGRPFQIGTLYNYNSDTIVPGTFLWDPDDIRRKIRKSEHRKKKIHIFEADQQGKWSSLGIDDHLMIGLMGNMITDYDGAFGYIDDQHEADQVGACLHCRAVDRIEEVEPKQLKGLEFLCQNEILQRGTATHVVVAIKYGAECFCVARQSTGEDRVEENVVDQLKECLEKWATCVQNGDDMCQSDLDLVPCRLYTDIEPHSPPRNGRDCYANCVSVHYVDRRSAVPLKVWLCPLRQITIASPRKQVQEVSKDVVDRTFLLWTQFQMLSRRLDESSSRIQSQVTCPSIEDKVATCRLHVQKYRKLVDSRLSEVIARVRRGAADESAINQVIALIRQSPFDPEKLYSWITLKDKEMEFLCDMATVPNIRLLFCKNPVDQSTRSFCLLLRLASLSQDDDTELEQMRLYVERNPELVSWNAPLSAECKNPVDSALQLRSQVEAFSQFISSTIHTNDVDYVVVYDSECQSTRYELHQSGRLISDQIRLPAAPTDLRVVSNRRGKLRLQWNLDEVKFFQHFLIEFLEDQQSEWRLLKDITTSVFEFANLKQNTAYYFRVATVYAFGHSRFSEPVGPETVEPICAAPTSVELRLATECSLSIFWNEPAHDDEVPVSGYHVEYRPKGEDSPLLQIRSTTNRCRIEKLQKATCYLIQVTPLCGSLGMGVASDPVAMETNKEAERVALVVRDYIDQLHADHVDRTSHCLPIFHLPLKETFADEKYGARRCQFGSDLNRFVRKTILVVGATGAGKTTLINGMINYILGVNFDDELRFKLVREPSKTQAHSQTEHVTAYDIFRMRGSKLDYSLTIVDTPGFGDTRGLERDRMIMEQVRQYFQNANGIQELEAVCFLLPASLPRLTPTQKNTYDSILSIFGRDIKDNIRLMITFADNDVPPVLDAVRESDIPYPVDASGRILYHKFNSNSLFPTIESNLSSDTTRTFYDMAIENFRQFFAHLGRMKTTSLSLTKEVLLERKRLEVVAEGLHQRIQHVLNQVEELEQIKKALAENQETLTANENILNIEVEVLVPKSVDISASGNYVTNCDVCKWTCHYPCKYANDKDRKDCLVMDGDGNCKICPGKCSWQDHFHQKIRYEREKKKVDRSLDEIRRQYEEAENRKLTHEELVDQLTKQVSAHEKSIADLVSMTYPSVKRLNEIALKPHSFSQLQYIDLLIKTEENEHRDGYLQRIERLRHLRQTTEIQWKMITDEKVLESGI